MLNSIQQVRTLMYLVFLWVNTSSEERSLPAVNVLLSVTRQLNLTQVFIHIPVRHTRIYTHTLTL